jgi:hypothetical protein
VAILLGVSPGLARIRDMVGGQERDVLETDLLSHPRSVLEGRP